MELDKIISMAWNATDQLKEDVKTLQNATNQLKEDVKTLQNATNQLKTCSDQQFTVLNARLDEMERNLFDKINKETNARIADFAALNARILQQKADFAALNARILLQQNQDKN